MIVKSAKRNDKGAGKGDKLRGGFSGQYRDNYDVIKWGDNDKCVNAQNAKKISKKQN